MKLLARISLGGMGLLLMLPVLSVLASWWPQAQSAESAVVLAGMWETVIPSYTFTSLWLCLLVAVGVAMVGGGAAAAVSLFDFPGRRMMEWAMLLPLAMPAYVLAFAYTDFLQFSGPAQTWVRELTGLQGRVLPEVRSFGGAVVVFVFALYPYVYVLTRTALTERATHLMEAARLLGAGLGRRILTVALPLSRPAIAAGVALALMETLADFGVSSYFGIQTFSAGVYKAWLAMDDRLTAARLATVLLVVVAGLLLLERHAQGRMRFVTGKAGLRKSADAVPHRLRGWQAVVAWLLCAVPVFVGFILPVLFMLRPMMQSNEALDVAQFALWAFNSLKLALMASGLACALALGLAFAARREPKGLAPWVLQLTSLGYAVPGAVVVVGVLLPVGWLQLLAPQTSVGFWVTATSLGIVWAYLVRFSAVALQTVQSGYTRIPASLDDSTRMLGRSTWAMLRHVHWPLLRRTVGAAALLVFVDVMKELPATLVLRPFNSDTLAVVAYQFARDERLGEAALPALAIVLVGLIPVIMLSRTLHKKD